MNSLSGSASSSEFDNVSMELKDVYKQASNISAAFHTVESNTRIAEKNLIDTYNLSKAATQFNVQKARLLRILVVPCHTVLDDLLL